MKTSQTLRLFLGLCLGLLLIGCSAKITAEAPPAPQDNPPAFDITLANGTWSTGCYINKAGFASEQTLILNNGNFSSTSKYYNLNKCEAQDLANSSSNQGRFVVLQESKQETGSFEVDLEIPLGNGATQIMHDLVRLDGGKLYLGDGMAPTNGNYPSKVDMTKPFSK